MGGFIRVLGLMSGTSADGVDMAIITTNGQEISSFGRCASLQYTANEQQYIKGHFGYYNKTAKIRQLEEFITHKHINAIEQNFQPHEYDIIGFHGQTIYHQPHKRQTRQLGNGVAMAEYFKKPVVYDFRHADVKMGGQGAPLIPVFHRAIGKKMGVAEPFVMANIGGVANITYCDGDNILAGDIGPGNGLMDDYMAKQFNQPFDNNGAMAGQGQVIDHLVNEWLSHPFFDQPLPKSIDRNMFHHINLQGHNPHNIMASLNEFTARAFARHLRQLPKKPNLIIMGGGGRFNQLLCQKIAQQNQLPVKPIDELYESGHYAEAQAFAYLAARAIYNYPYCFPTTSSSPKNHGIAKIIKNR